MKLKYFILSPLLCIAANDSQGSCLHSCGQAYTSSLPCQCNLACTKHANCCNDYNDSCPKELCVDNCDKPYNKTHRCHCNTACKHFNNCCDDYDDFCLLRVNDSSPTEYTKSDTTFITSDFHKESTSRPTTSLSKHKGMIIGIVISISVLVLTILVILAFMYRRTYGKENASLNTAGREDRNTNNIDNNTVISDYQQLDDVDAVQKKTNAYDQLSVTRNVHTESTNDQANTSFSREEYSKYESIVDSNGINTNTVISDYEELHKSDTDTSTQAYDQLNVTREVKTEPTNFFSKITASTEKHSKTESTKATAATSEYEQLDNAKKDKGVNVYDQLHVTDMIDDEQTNYKSKTTKPRDQQSNDKPTEETTKLNKRTVTSEYEHLDNATKDTSVNVYDNLNDSGVMDNDPTHHNPCQ